GASGTTSLPEKYDARQAFDILDEKFSAGRIQPTEIVIEAEDINDPAVQEGIAELQAAFSVDERYTLVNGVQVLREDPAGTDLALVSVTVPGESASEEAIDAMKFIRSDIVPSAFEGTSATVYVGGPTAGNADFFDM